ncbi:MAG: hypothetical protein H0W70_14150, partial [Actinobacteria bacterium]|nr:hypothetical protein [Actinomycetota bacterium]
GRLVQALRAGPVAWDDIPTVMGWPDDDARARRVAATLAADGLVDFTLPIACVGAQLPETAAT